MPNWVQKLSPALLKSEFTENPERKCRIIIEMASSQSDRVANYVEANEGKVHRHLKLVPSVVVEVPYAALQYMVMSPHVKKIWHDTKVKTLLDIAVPTAGGNKAHGLGLTGKDVTVAVIDTGIFSHPDLIYPENRIIGWNDLVNGRANPYDDNGHGTHVSGIIAGNGTISRGKYAGMAPDAKLVGVKALDSEGSGNTSDIITAVEWCIENQKAYNIRAINLSLGGTAQDSYRQDPLCRALSSAWNSGIVVCVAAGNDGPDASTINTPGISPNVITVGNLDDRGTEDVSDDVISDSSSRGPTVDNLVKPDLLAPGTNITSLRSGGGYRSLSGTSMATPMVTGAVAQIFQKWPSYKPDQAKKALTQNARAMGLQSNFQGSGALNLTDLFDESKKSDTAKQRSLFSMLFGKELFQRRSTPPESTPPGSAPADGAKKQDNVAAEEKGKANEFKPLPLAMLMLLPFVL